MLRIKIARDQRLRHAVRDRLIIIQLPQRNGVDCAECILLERTAEIIQLVIRMHRGHDGDLPFCAHHRPHHIRPSAVAVDQLRLKLIHKREQLTACRQWIFGQDQLHTDALRPHLLRERTVAEADHADLMVLVQLPNQRKNMCLCSADVTAAHHLHDSHSDSLQCLFSFSIIHNSAVHANCFASNCTSRQFVLHWAQTIRGRKPKCSGIPI